jgi:hypothetical protein
MFAADAHVAEGQLLCEKTAVNKVKSLKFWIGKRMPTVSNKI